MVLTRVQIWDGVDGKEGGGLSRRLFERGISVAYRYAAHTAVAVAVTEPDSKPCNAALKCVKRQ